MYECSDAYGKGFLSNNDAPHPGPCFAIHQTQGSNNTRTWEKIRSMCNKISLAWAVGGDLIQDFPSNMAYPLGGSEQEFEYFILEIHYDNPTLLPGIFLLVIL
jgi:hypothetical protein